MTQPTFYGRHEEQRRFRQAVQELNEPVEGKQLPTVFLLSGQGGIGKTRLSLQFMEIGRDAHSAADHCLKLDWEEIKKGDPRLQVNREHLDPFDVLEILHQELGQATAHPFKNYTEASKLYLDAMVCIKKLDDERKTAGKSEEVVAAGVGGLASLVHGSLKTPAEKVAATALEALNKVQGNLKPEHYRALANRNAQLAGAMGRDLANHTERNPLIILLDTYEIIDRVDFLMRHIIREAGPRVLWVIAGRRDLKSSGRWGSEYYTGYAEEDGHHFQLVHYNVAELARDDVAAFFTELAPKQPTLDEAQITTVLRATRSIPLALRCAAQIWNETGHLDDVAGAEDIPAEKIVNHMVDRYLLHCLTNTDDRQDLHALALAQGNRALLEKLLARHPNPEQRIDALERNYAAVYREAQRLHDEPQAFFRQNLRNLRDTAWVQAMVKTAVAYFRECLDAETAELPRLDERIQDRDWQKPALQYLNTLCFLDINQAWHWFYPRYIEAMAYSGGFADALLDGLSAWEDCLKRRGKNRLHLLREANSVSAGNSAIEARLQEWHKWQENGWLTEPKEEGEHREAIFWWLVGRDHFRLKQMVKANKAYRKAHGLWTPSEKQLGVRLSDDVTNLVCHYGEVRNIAEGLVLSRMALTCNGENAVCFHNIGNLLGHNQEFEEALAAYNKAIAIDPQLAAPWYGKGYVLLSLNKPEDALAAYNKAIAINPHDALPWNGKGNVLRSLNKPEDALAAYNKAIAIDPHYALPWNGKGNVLRSLNKPEDALAAYNKAIAIDPHHAFPWNGKGYVLLSLNKPEDALAAYNKAIAIDPHDARLWNNKGLLLAGLGKMDEAVAALEKALELAPVNPHLLESLARVRFVQGEPAQASELCTTALTQLPASFECKLTLAAAFLKLDHPERFTEILTDLQTGVVTETDPYLLACFHVLNDDIPQGLDYLAQACQERPGWYLYARHSPPLLARLADHPRFRELMHLTD